MAERGADFLVNVEVKVISLLLNKSLLLPAMPTLILPMSPTLRFPFLQNYIEDLSQATRFSRAQNEVDALYGAKFQVTSCELISHYHID